MFTKLIRLGRDAELKTTTSGKAVCEFTGAYDIGYGDNKHPQWVKCSLWGDRGAKVAQYLTKGSQVVVTLDDLKSRAYINNQTNEPVGTLEGRVVSFDFAGDKQNTQQTQIQQAPQQQTPQAGGYNPNIAPHQAPQGQQQPSGFDDFSDDIGF